MQQDLHTPKHIRQYWRIVELHTRAFDRRHHRKLAVALGQLLKSMHQSGVNPLGY